MFIVSPRAFAQTFSFFGNSADACGRFLLSVKRRADVMLVYSARSYCVVLVITRKLLSELLFWKLTLLKTLPAVIYRVGQNKPDYLLSWFKFFISTAKHVSMIMYM